MAFSDTQKKSQEMKKSLISYLIDFFNVRNKTNIGFSELVKYCSYRHGENSLKGEIQKTHFCCLQKVSFLCHEFFLSASSTTGKRKVEGNYYC